jgi:hypothetical protein
MAKLNFSVFVLVLLAISMSTVSALEEVAQYHDKFNVDVGDATIIIDSGSGHSICGDTFVDINAGEQCDRINLNGQTCASLLGS